MKHPSSPHAFENNKSNWRWQTSSKLQPTAAVHNSLFHLTRCFWTPRKMGTRHLLPPVSSCTAVNQTDVFFLISDRPLTCWMMYFCLVFSPPNIQYCMYCWYTTVLLYILYLLVICVLRGFHQRFSFCLLTVDVFSIFVRQADVSQKFFGTKLEEAIIPFSSHV